MLGKLFTSRTRNKGNTELLVIVTPEIVRPIPKGMPVPDLNRPMPFMEPNTAGPMAQPGIDKTGPVPVHPPQPSVPFEQLMTPHAQAAGPAASDPHPGSRTGRANDAAHYVEYASRSAGECAGRGGASAGYGSACTDGQVGEVCTR